MGDTVPVLIGASILKKSGLEKSNPEKPGSGEAQTTILEIAAFITDLTSLKAAQEELRKAYEELEKKVVERTAALEAEVSERKRAEMGLRELTGRLLITQDEERRHMARELHDHAGQTLAVLAMNLSALRKAAAQSGQRLWPAYRATGGRESPAFRRAVAGDPHIFLPAASAAA